MSFATELLRRAAGSTAAGDRAEVVLRRNRGLAACSSSICDLPEYYPTRTELALLDQHADDIAALHRARRRDRRIRRRRQPSRCVSCWTRLQAPLRFVPVDISGEHLQGRRSAAAPRLPAARRWQPLVADFTAGLDLPPAAGRRRVGFFPGSSIGNFEPDAGAAPAARAFRGWLPGGGLLIGVDLVKDPGVLHAAYNDARGITASFNLNLLARANRELGADFDLDGLVAHAAFYKPPLQAHRDAPGEPARTERARSPAKALSISPKATAFTTENSYKYTVDGFAARWRDGAGFDVRKTLVWTDAARRFALHWLAPRRRMKKEGRMKAIWNGTVVAESDDTVVVEGNHYFPADSREEGIPAAQQHQDACARGRAKRVYHTLFVDGNANPDAVWYYPDPKEAAAQIKGRVAFWKGVQVVE